MIEIRHLTKVYDGKPAVRQLSFEVGASEIFGFIGPNGAGKTTTLRMLATLLRPTSGAARVCNFDVRTHTNDVRRRIGYMPDFFGVYDDMRVEDYLKFFAAAYEVPKSARKRILADVLELTDLGSVSETLIGDLSRGMQQRIALARCLVHDPPVLLLDEPASGLDPRARLELLDILRELRSMGKTILISSHILSELADVSDRFGILDQGRMIASGSLDELTEGMGARRVHVEVAGNGIDLAMEALRAHDSIAEVEAAENGTHRLEVTLTRDAPEIDFIASLLVDQGHRVTHLSQASARLEDAFLHLTEGREQ